MHIVRIRLGIKNIVNPSTIFVNIMECSKTLFCYIHILKEPYIKRTAVQWPRYFIGGFQGILPSILSLNTTLLLFSLYILCVYIWLHGTHIYFLCYSVLVFASHSITAIFRHNCLKGQKPLPVFIKVKAWRVKRGNSERRSKFLINLLQLARLFIFAYFTLKGPNITNMSKILSIFIS